MADIDLTVELKPVVQSDALQKAITDEVEKINKTPQKVTVELDDSKIKQQISDISKLLKDLEKIKSATGVGKGGGGRGGGGTNELVKGTIAYNNALNKVNKSLAEVHSNSRKWTSAQTGATSGDYALYQQQAQNLENLKAALESGTLKAADFAKQYSDISTTMTSAASSIKIAGENIKETATSSTTLVQGTVAYNDALNKVNKTIAQVSDNSRKWTAAQNGQSQNDYNNLLMQIPALEQLKTQLESGQMSAEAFANAFSNINNVITTSSSNIKAVGENIKSSAASSNVLVNGTVAYNEALNKVNKTIAQVTENSRKWTAAQNGQSKNDYNTLLQQIPALEQLRTQLETGKMTTEQFASAFSNITNTITTASSNIKVFGENMKTASASNAKLVAGTKEYNDALTKLYTLQAKINKNAEDWSAAKTGKASGYYESYIGQAKAVQDLIDNLENYTPEELKGKLSGINAVLAESESGIKNFGADTKSIFDSLGGSFKRFAQYFGMSRVIMASIQKIKEMARASIEVESAMNRIQIVTGASDSQMTSFFQSATAQAKELGQSITDVAASLESFSRLGFSLSEATELSKYANIMANVADTDVATATTGITSIMKGYGLDVSETEHVADVLIKVGQEYAISAEELMEAFQRGGSAMAASNTSFEKTASLFAATNASLECWRVA